MLFPQGWLWQPYVTLACWPRRQTAKRMSPHTVDGRLRRVFAKLGVNTRVELTAEHARVTG